MESLTKSLVRKKVEIVQAVASMSTASALKMSSGVMKEMNRLDLPLSLKALWEHT